MRRLIPLTIQRAKLLTIAVWLILAGGLLLSPAAMYGAAPSCPAGQACLSTPDLNIPTLSVDSGLKSVITLLSFIAGVLSVIFIILGGIRYSSSSGDPSKVTSAKQTITFAVIGLALSFLAPLIVGFIIASGPHNT